MTYISQMLLNKKQLEIFTPFTTKTNLEITASELARKTNNNQKTTYRYLEELTKESILETRTQGKNKLYRLHKNNKELTKQFLQIIEHAKTYYFYKTKPAIKLILEELKSNIKGTTILFGSQANNTNNELSDIDLYIIGSYNKDKIKEIEKTYNIKIDIKQAKTYEENTLTKEIRKNHIIIKGVEEAVKYFNE